MHLELSARARAIPLDPALVDDKFEFRRVIIKDDVHGRYVRVLESRALAASTAE